MTWTDEDWTDERLGALLTETFREHEALAEPEEATRIARDTMRFPDRRRGRWAAIGAAAAIAAVVAGTASYAVQRSAGDHADDGAFNGPNSAVAGGPAVNAPVPARTTAQNMADAKAVSAALLAALPKPPGTQVWSHSPNDHFRQAWSGVGPADGRLSRHAWWTVPLSRADFTHWLATHHPAGMHLQGSAPTSTSVASNGVWTDETDYVGTSTAAHTAPVLHVEFIPDGDRLAVRLDTFIAARFARTDFVPADVTRVSLRRTVTRAVGTPRTTVRTVMIDDRQRIADLVRRSNALPGAMTVPVVMSCPMTTETTIYRLEFDGPTTAETLTVPTTNCGPAEGVLRRGETRLGSTIDVSALPTLLAGYFG